MCYMFIWMLRFTSTRTCKSSATEVTVDLLTQVSFWSSYKMIKAGQVCHSMLAAFSKQSQTSAKLVRHSSTYLSSKGFFLCFFRSTSVAAAERSAYLAALGLRLSDCVQLGLLLMRTARADFILTKICAGAQTINADDQVIYI